jgi:hypothetical protein
MVKDARGGDSGPAILCYRPRAGSKVFLLFESDAAGGYGEIATGFRITEQEPYQLRLFGSNDVVGVKACEVARAVGEYLVLPNGLKLGMTSKQVLALLGPPTSQTKSRISYVIDKERLWAQLEVSLERDKVVALRVERSDIE